VVNHYLVLAFGFLWVIFMLYAWSLSRRQSKLKRDLDELKSQLREQPPTGSTSL
jgi:CcmD family protein